MARSNEFQTLLELAPSPIEVVLQTYGFADRAAQLRHRRISETTQMLANFGIVVQRPPES